MDKEERLFKYLNEHPGELLRLELKISEENSITNKERPLRLSTYKSAKEKLSIERAEKMFELYKELHTYQEIADVFELTRERIRQIIMKYHGNEFIEMKPILAKKRQELARERLINRKWVCEFCGVTFKKQVRTKFCTKACFRKAISVVKYPDWLKGRKINRENFSEWEWREINRIRTNSYYQRHKEHLNKKSKEWRENNKERFALYQKRSKERKAFGAAITDLPNPINIKAMKGAQNSKELLAQCPCDAVKYMEKEVVRWQPSIARFKLLPEEKCPKCKVLKI